MSKLDDIKRDAVLLSTKIEEAVKEAYNKGYLDGLSTEKPSQAEFDEQHKEVTPYGEDQDLLVLSGDYTYEQAEEKYRSYLKEELGRFDDELGEVENMKQSNVSYELYDGEPGFYIRADRGGIYDCWLLELDG